MAVSFIGGGNRSAGKETPPCRKKKDRQNNDQNKKGQRDKTRSTKHYTEN